MSGAYSGVSARIKELNPKAVYVHSCAHCLNLALVDSVKALPVLKTSLPFHNTLCLYVCFQES